MKNMCEEEFIKSKYSGYEPENIKSVFNFPFIWSIFEYKYANNYAKTANIKDYQSKCSDDLEIEDIWNYFKSRYINKEGQTTNYYEDILFTNGQDRYKENVKTILLKGSPENSEKLCVLFHIVFRLRNNLYHGEKLKEKLDLIKQNENFKFANKFLIRVIRNKK